VNREEECIVLEFFPSYAVSNFGYVVNVHTDRIKAATANRQGIAIVNLSQEGQQYCRSVTVLVADIFLPLPSRAAFDTPINLDGDRFNNHIVNLAWRPRWFASKYHAQFKKQSPFRLRGVLEIVQTGEVFQTIRDCASEYGLLETDIVQAAHNLNPIFPTGQEFKLTK
jgi:hypothetical protein